MSEFDPMGPEGLEHGQPGAVDALADPPPRPNPFCGVVAHLWEPTADGRTLTGVTPLVGAPVALVEDGEPHTDRVVGRVDRLTTSGHLVVAEGEVDLPPGVYGVAVNLDVSRRTADGGLSGRVAALVVSWPHSRTEPAWNAHVVVRARP